MIQINYLCDVPEFIETIGEYVWNEWKEDFMELTNNCKSKQALIEFYSYTHRIGDNELPCCFVLHDDDEFISCVLVDKEDMGVCPHLSPWLANVFTVPAYRGEGYASRLLCHVCNLFPILHLWTFNKKLVDFYARFGFAQFMIIEQHGKHKNIICAQRVVLGRERASFNVINVAL